MMVSLLTEAVKVSHAKRVLVIDDESVVCNSCRRVLEREGYQVSVATSAREGMKKVTQEHYDVAIIDLRMPGLDGMDVLRQVKDSNPHTRVIIITGYSSVPTAVEAMQLGAADYLPKPFTPKELSDRVKGAIAAGEKPSEPQPEKAGVSPEKGLLAGPGEDKELDLPEARILLAGSHTEQMVAICQCLFSEPWRVGTASTCDEVIEKVKAGQADVLILGVDVFGMKAYDMIPELKKLGSKIPVIVASAEASLDLAQRLREVGIFFHLMEPFDPWEVKVAVRDAVRRSATLKFKEPAAGARSKFVRSLQTLTKDGTKVRFLAVGEGMDENGGLYREIIRELNERDLPVRIDHARGSLTAKEFPRYLEEDHRVVILAPFDARTQKDPIVGYSASEFEELATSEQQIRLKGLAYPEVLHWLRAQGIAPDVRIVCLPGGYLGPEQIQEAATITIAKGLG